MARSRRARRKKPRHSPAGRWAARIAVAVVALGVLGVLGGYFWLHKFLRSDKFLAMVNTRVSESLGAEARFAKLEWDGMQLRAPDFEVSGEEMIRSIEMHGLETEVKLRPLLSRRVETHDIRVRRLHVEVDVTKEGPEVQGGNTEALKFSTLGIDDFSGVVDFGSSAIKWEGVGASLTPGHAKGSFDATLVRGRVTTPLSLFPEPKLQEASIRYVDKMLFVKSGDWKVYESGRLKTEGEIDLESGEFIFNGELTNVQCEEMLPDDWKKRLRGELSSTFTVQGEGKGAPVIEGALELVRGHLTALPVLDSIAAYTDTERFRRLSLRKANMAYRQEGELLELTEVVIASEGLLRIEGELTVNAGRLDGLFQLGITPGTLAAIPGAETKVFHPGKRGMLWAPVHITGTTEVPTEDLSERLIAAAGERMFEMVPETGQLVLKHSGRAAGEMAKAILKTTGEAAEVGLQVVEGGAGILRNGVTPGDVIDPIRNGVGSIFESILGDPSRRVDPAPPKPRTPKEMINEKEKDLENKGKELEKDSQKSAEEEARKAVDEQEGESLQEKAEKLLEEEFGPSSR